MDTITSHDPFGPFSLANELTATAAADNIWVLRSGSHTRLHIALAALTLCALYVHCMCTVFVHYVCTMCALCDTESTRSEHAHVGGSMGRPLCPAVLSVRNHGSAPPLAMCITSTDVQ
jgi:hypothetical protein